MRNRFLISAALSLTLTAGAHAQFPMNGQNNGFIPLGGLGTGFVGNLGSFTANPFGSPNPFNGPLRFVPGVGFVQQSGFSNPGFLAGVSGNGVFTQNPGYLQFTPGVGFTPNPAYVPNLGAATPGATNNPTTVSPGPGVLVVPAFGGGGFYPGDYYYGYYAYPGGYPADYYGSGAGAVNPNAYGAEAPGVPSNGPPRIDIRPSASSRTPAERRALLAAARRERQEEARIDREYRALARANAVVPGTLVSVRNNIARVRYRVNGGRRLGRFSTDRVYIFPYTRADGETHVATLASAPGLAQEGDRVMVGLPRPVTATRGRTSILISNR